MDGFQNISLEQAADLIAARVRVKQAGPGTADAAPAADSLNKTMIGVRQLQGAADRANDPKSRASDSYHSVEPPADPGIADRVRAMLSNIDFSSLANKGMDAAKNFSPGANPLHAALLGGGLGMGVGALGSLTSSDKEKRKRWLRNALFGGAMGGLGGYGANAALTYGNKLINDASARETAELNKPQVPTLPEAASHAASSGLPLIAATTAGGALVDRGLSRRAVNKGRNASLIESMHNKAFQPFVDKANTGLAANKLPAVTPEQQAAHIAPKPPAGNPVKAFQKYINENAANIRNSAKDFLTRTYPINRKPPVIPPNPATGYHPTTKPPVTPPPPVVPKLSPPQLKALHSANKSYLKPEVKATLPKQRSGVRGALIGAGLGTALSMAGTPHLSIAQKQQQQQQQAGMTPTF